MPKRNFQATEGLLHDVMRKQSGVIEKAWLEALMNSVDAGATEFSLNVEPETTTITDNGDSMTKPEVERYFEQFGLKDSDIQDKEFGKFRMGRGQIFNFGVNIWRARENYMVVSLDDEEATVNLEECTAEDDECIISQNGSHYTVDTSGLGYALLDADKVDSGLIIHVEHYNPIEDVTSAVDEFRQLARYVSWVHDIEVTVNGDVLDDEPEVIQESHGAWFVEADSSYSNRCPVYNKGAHVNEFNLGPRRIAIITKYDLDVTLDRTDILDTGDYWQQIQSQYTQVVEAQLVESDELTDNEVNWLLKRAANNVNLMNSVSDKPMLQDITGDYRTIAEVASSRIGFSTRDDSVAKDAMEKNNVTVLQETYEDVVKEFSKKAQTAIEESSLKSYDELVDDELAFEMTERNEDDLSKTRRKNLERIRLALSDLGFREDVKPGYSNHRDVWTDGEDTLFLDKDFLNMSKQDVATELLYQAIRGAAHDGDSRPGFNEDYGFNRQFYRLANGDNFGSDANLPEVQQKLLNGRYDSQFDI